MCCTLEQATLGSTIILSHRLQKDGETVNVLGYGNSPKSANAAVNAMILPIPSAEKMGPENFIDGTGLRKVLKSFAEKVRGRSRGASMSKSLSFDIQVFQSGAYTVVLTQNSSFEDVLTTINGLPENRRPAIESKRALFQKYREWYPGYHIAICIWGNAIEEADPILLWYKPMEEYHNKDWLPGLDAHDGNLPKIGVQVPVDHTLILGGVGQSTSGADVVDIVASAPQHLRPWLPLRVTAHEVKYMMINGDWKISRDERGSVNKEWWTERSSPTE